MRQPSSTHDPLTIRLPFPCGCVAFSGPGDAYVIEWCPQHTRTHEVLHDAAQRTSRSEPRATGHG